MYKEKKKEYLRTKDYMSHKTPENTQQGYEDADIEKKYQETSKENLLYKIANRPLREQEEDEEIENISDTIKITQRETVPREDITEIKQLRCKGPEIIGNLFDKVQFLEERIQELTSAIELRKKINAEIIKDIEEDIRDKETFATQCTDFDDLRSIKLHISMLKQQKRKELIQHFHDTVELSTELQALREEYQTEQKITSLFEDIRAA